MTGEEAAARKAHKDEVKAMHTATVGRDKMNKGTDVTTGSRINMDMNSDRRRHGTD